jgi:hypothetical protein
MNLLDSSVVGGGTPYLETFGLVVIWVDCSTGCSGWGG